MNYAQNYKDVTKSPLQELMKIEETFKKELDTYIDPLDISNAHINVDQLNASSPNETNQLNASSPNEADKYWTNALSSTKPA